MKLEKASFLFFLLTYKSMKTTDSQKEMIDMRNFFKISAYNQLNNNFNVKNSFRLRNQGIIFLTSTSAPFGDVRKPQKRQYRQPFGLRFQLSGNLLSKLNDCHNYKGKNMKAKNRGPD